MFFSKEIFICLRASLVAALWGVLSLGAYAQGIADLFDAKTQKMLGSIGGAWSSAAQGNTGKAASSGGAGQSTALDGLGSLTFGGSNAPNSNYTYRYNPQVSVNLRNQLAKAVAGQMGNISEKELADVFKEMNLVERMSAALESKGYAKHSLATAAAYWMVQNLEIVYDTEFTDKQNGATFRQMEQRLADIPEFSQLDDGEKQHIAELLIWMATLQYMEHQDALRGTPGKKSVQSAVQRARTALALLQINPDDFRLTAEGLVAR